MVNHNELEPSPLVNKLQEALWKGIFIRAHEASLKAKRRAGEFPIQVVEQKQIVIYPKRVKKF